MTIQGAIKTLIGGSDLDRDTMASVMRGIMSGECSDAQIAGFLVALAIKGETVDEITAAVSVMREKMTPVRVENPEALIDIVGTGGDGASIFNVSTASSIVAAAAGATVAKHGNRSVSSSSGAADLLEAAGVNLNLDAEAVGQCIDEVGLGFMFAVNHHPSMKYAITARRELAVRTVFNLLGPMTNPAGVKRQVLGVYAEQWQRPLAEVLASLGSRHVMVVHSADGLDEISIAAKTRVVELKDGSIDEYEISPADFGLKTAELSGLKVGNAGESLQLIQSLLGGNAGAAADMVALNAGAAIYVAGLASDLKEAVLKAQQVLAEGSGLAKLRELAEYTRQVGAEK